MSKMWQQTRRVLSPACSLSLPLFLVAYQLSMEEPIISLNYFRTTITGIREIQMMSAQLLETCYKYGVGLWLGTPFVLVPVLRYIKAPYGKFANSNFGTLINGKWGWFIQESISPIMFTASFAGFAIKFLPNGIYSVTIPQWLLVAAWNAHYWNRSVIYTLRAPAMKPSPISVVLAAVSFNIVNGYINGYEVAKTLDGGHSLWNMTIGLLIFAIGMYGNIAADNTLMNLRKGRDPKGYYIPEGGLYNYISCPNYFCEIVEWFGFAIASNFSLASIGFVAMSIANLGPRALSTHKWYVEKFGDKYPAKRRAIIPFFL